MKMTLTQAVSREERHLAAMSRLRAFGRELRKIVNVTLNPTDEELSRMKCLCVAIEDTNRRRTGFVFDGWDSAAYRVARDIIARHEHAKGAGNG